MIKLKYIQYSKYFTAKIENIAQLSVPTLQGLEDFCAIRSGILDYNKEELYIPKVITVNHLQQLLQDKGFEVFITEFEPKRVKLGSEAVIKYGKFKGTRWRDLDINYLEWLKNNLTGQDRDIAVDEINRRKISKEDGQPKELKEKIGFGKYRGKEWGELPLDYLTWVASNLQGEVKRYAEVVLNYKVANKVSFQ